jgi:hypothetical protein
VSKAAYFGYKMTFDAAVVRRAKRGHKKWTTIILQVLCCGVEHGKWGRNAIVGMLEKAQSANKFAKVRVWNGGDDRANFEAHVVPLIDQLLELQEKGMMVDELMMPLPPCIITLGEDENVAVPASMKKIVDIPEHEMVPEHKTVIGMHWRGGAQNAARPKRPLSLVSCAGVFRNSTTNAMRSRASARAPPLGDLAFTMSTPM